MGAIVEVNGTRLYYEVDGPDGAPALVFVHGFSLDTRMWDGQIAAFAARYRVVRYDLRGFGRSAVPETGVEYQHQEDLRGLLDCLGVEHAALVGLSFGGAVAVDFTLRHPDRVSALVFVDTTLPGFEMPDLDAIGIPIWKVGRTDGVEAARALFLETPLFEGANERPSSREAVRMIVGDYSGWDWIARDPSTWAEPNCLSCLDRITAPTLVVVGERDIEGMHLAADALAAGIADARKVVLPGLGHLPNMEDPAAVNRVVLDFLSSLD